MIGMEVIMIATIMGFVGLIGRSEGRSGDVIRPDYGVVFDRKQDIFIASGKWRHSFIIPTPSMIPFATVQIDCLEEELAAFSLSRNLGDREEGEPHEPPPKRPRHQREVTVTGNEIPRIPHAQRAWHDERMARANPAYRRLNDSDILLANTVTLSNNAHILHGLEKRLDKEQRFDRRGRRFISAAICHQFSSLFAEMKVQYDNVVGILNDTKLTMRNLIQYRSNEDQSLDENHGRSKRFMGYLEKEYHVIGDYFGWASQQEAAEIREHMKNLEKWADNATTAFGQIRDTTSSYMEINNIRLNAAVDQIGGNMGQVSQLWERFTHAQTSMAANKHDIGSIWHMMDQLILYLSGGFKNQLLINHALTSLSVELNQHLASIQTLIRGYLPVQLVPAEQLEKALAAIGLQLRLHYPQFRLATESVASFYDRAGVIFAFNQENIVITVEIPLIAHRSSKFKTFQVKSIPVTINPGGEPTGEFARSATQLVTKYKYFAISYDTAAYLQLTQDKYSGCLDQSSRIFCEELFPLVDYAVPSCLKALYMDDTDIIIELCDFKYYPKLDSGPEYIDLGGGKIMLTNVASEWTKICDDAFPVHVDVCTNCIFTLDSASCGYKIGKQFYLPPRFRGKAGAIQASQSQIIPIRNLAFATQFGSGRPFRSNLSMTMTVKRKLSSFNNKVQDKNRRRFLAEDRAVAFELRGLARQMDTIAIPEITRVEWLQNAMLYHFGPITRALFITACFLGAVSGPLAIVGIVYTYQRVTHLRGLMMISHAVGTVKALYTVGNDRVAFEPASEPSSWEMDLGGWSMLGIFMAAMIMIFVVSGMTRCFARRHTPQMAELKLTITNRIGIYEDFVLQIMTPFNDQPTLSGPLGLEDIRAVFVPGLYSDRIYLTSFRVEITSQQEAFVAQVPDHITTARSRNQEIKRLFRQDVVVSSLYLEQNDCRLQYTKYPDLTV
jgi:hypothetical protein